jgi:hypothetical protein
MSAKHTANHINRTLTWYRENPDAITREGGVDEVIRAMRRRVGKRDGDDFAMWESQHPVTRLRYRSGYWDFEADIALFRSEFAPPAADRPTPRLVPTLPTEFRRVGRTYPPSRTWEAVQAIGRVRNGQVSVANLQTVTAMSESWCRNVLRTLAEVGSIKWKKPNTYQVEAQ